MTAPDGTNTLGRTVLNIRSIDVEVPTMGTTVTVVLYSAAGDILLGSLDLDVSTRISDITPMTVLFGDTMLKKESKLSDFIAPGEQSVSLTALHAHGAPSIEKADLHSTSR